jgi:hypothetical protein
MACSASKGAGSDNGHAMLTNAPTIGLGLALANDDEDVT